MTGRGVAMQFMSHTRSSAIFKSGRVQQPISVGGDALIAPNALTAYSSEGDVTDTTLLVNSELSDRVSVLVAPQPDS